MLFQHYIAFILCIIERKRGAQELIFPGMNIPTSSHINQFTGFHGQRHEGRSRFLVFVTSCSQIVNKKAINNENSYIYPL